MSTERADVTGHATSTVVPNDASEAGRYEPTLLAALPGYVLDIMGIIERAGGECWVVGGFVRDAILGRTIHDVDIASNMLAHKAMEVFSSSGYSVIPTGLEHGTITVLAQDNAVEITTYRVDGAYLDARHPDYVEFVRTIQEDLARRDFTINAMAFHPERGLIDPFGGLADIRSRTLRTVGSPWDRFAEDPLRILRACRFSSQLGYAIDAATFDAAGYCKRYLYRISAQRIAAELEGFICGDHIHDALLACIDLIAPVVPELYACKGFDQHSRHHIYNVLEHTAYVVQRTPVDPVLRWAALFHDAGKPQTFWLETRENGEVRGHFYDHAQVSSVLAQQAMNRLKLSASLIKDVQALIIHHDDKVTADHRSVRRMIHMLGDSEELFAKLIDLKIADDKSKDPLGYARIYAVAHLKDVLAEVSSANEAYSLRQLAISGSDLIAAGIEPGPRIGQLLERCLDGVIDESVPNTQQALIQRALSLLSAQDTTI